MVNVPAFQAGEGSSILPTRSKIKAPLWGFYLGIVAKSNSINSPNPLQLPKIALNQIIVYNT